MSLLGPYLIRLSSPILARPMLLFSEVFASNDITRSTSRVFAEKPRAVSAIDEGSTIEYFSYEYTVAVDGSEKSVDRPFDFELEKR